MRGSPHGGPGLLMGWAWSVGHVQDSLLRDRVTRPL